MYIKTKNNCRMSKSRIEYYENQVINSIELKRDLMKMYDKKKKNGNQLNLFGPNQSCEEYISEMIAKLKNGELSLYKDIKLGTSTISLMKFYFLI